MRLPSLVSFIGFVLLMAGTYCPLLRPFHLFNWDVYDLNKPYGMVILLVSVVGILGVVLNQLKLVRLTAWLSIALVLILLLSAFLKIHDTFSFIPFKTVSGFLGGRSSLNGAGTYCLAGRLLRWEAL